MLYILTFQGYKNIFVILKGKIKGQGIATPFEPPFKIDVTFHSSLDQCHMKYVDRPVKYVNDPTFPMTEVFRFFI